MNIYDYAPKHVNLSEVTKQAANYEGTFKELANLIKSKKVTLVTADNSGAVIGIYVKAHDDTMLDEIAGENFARAYMGKPIDKWTKIIIDANYAGVEPEEPEEDYHSREETNYEYDFLPESEEIDLDDLESDDLKSVRKYLKKKYRYCLAKGHQPDIETDEDENIVYVDNILWGRKLSDSELAEL